MYSVREKGTDALGRVKTRQVRGAKRRQAIDNSLFAWRDQRRCPSTFRVPAILSRVQCPLPAGADQVAAFPARGLPVGSRGPADRVHRGPRYLDRLRLLRGAGAAAAGKVA